MPIEFLIGSALLLIAFGVYLWSWSYMNKTLDELDREDEEREQASRASL